jgi:hypothetical protein
MQQSPKMETTTLTFAVSKDQRSEIKRLAAEYGHRVGRPVSVGEYLRVRALAELDQPVRSAA